MRCTGHVARMDEGRSAFEIVVGRPAEKSLLERPRHRWEDNIGMKLKEIGIIINNFIDLAQNRNYWRALVNVSSNLQVP